MKEFCRLIAENEECEVLFEVTVSCNDCLKVALDLASFLTHRYCEISGFCIKEE